ncbi:unnamed protein product [Sphenostylis stenocarpa]|uniref:Uncharacterized protein n=1 Tax=Sphenostylis stenocarpa TaxID=92480 RepID=A0AA86V9E3_9FABA|nr:unnamed protein product [Sphenostylis stenocarpa]
MEIPLGKEITQSRLSRSLGLEPAEINARSEHESIQNCTKPSRHGFCKGKMRIKEEEGDRVRRGNRTMRQLVRVDSECFVSLAHAPSVLLALTRCGDAGIGKTADWFRTVLLVKPVNGNLRLSGSSACGQNGGVQLPHEYVEETESSTFLCFDDNT